MIGVFVNAVSIVSGSIIGLFLRKKINRSVIDSIMPVVGLATVFIGIKGAFVGEKSILLVIVLALGTFIGTIIGIDEKLYILGDLIKKRFVKKYTDTKDNFVEGFVSSSILFGVGAMCIMGSIEAGIKHEYTIFFLKSTLDFISAIIYAASLGIGVAFSALTIFLLQGTLTILAGFIKFIGDNQSLMNEISCVGNIIIVAIGLNVMGITKIKIANMLPAIFLTPIIFYIIK